MKIKIEKETVGDVVRFYASANHQLCFGSTEEDAISRLKEKLEEKKHIKREEYFVEIDWE